jgi:transposase-like protein
LATLLEGGEGIDFLRESLRWVVQQLMEAEVSEVIGAEHGERNPERLTHRNGYRPRRWDTRAGEIELAIPKIRRGSYVPSFLEPRRRSEQALVSVIEQAYVCGVSTRKVDQLVESLGLRISKSEVARVCAGLDQQVDAFRSRPLEGRSRYVWLDAKVEKVRDGGRVVRKCVVIAHGVHESGRREVIGLDCGECETEAFWRDFLRGVVKRGLTGVPLVVSDAHEGLKNAIGQVLGAPWQRCTVHFPPRGARSRAQGAAADARRAESDRSSTPRRANKRASSSATRSRAWSDRCRGSQRCSNAPKTTCSPSTPSPSTTGASCARRIHWNGSTAKSAAAPTSSASSPTTPPGSGSRPASSSNRTTSGWSAAATYRSTRSLRSTSSEANTKNKRCSSSPRPEQPTITPASYTTSRDLTP